MRGKIIAALIAGIVFAAFASACDRDEPGPNVARPANANMATPAAVSLGTVTGNLDSYLGKSVTVEADVQEVFGPRAFTLDEDDALAGGIDNDVLVVGKQTGNLERIEDNWLKNKVRVTGTVRGVAVVDVEREVGWDLDPQIEAELQDVKAVIVASSLQRLQ